ncbi:MAG: hypothetical protein MJ252_08270, partial [archaeon]|nr:hypothetical protein [archaeon]
MKTKPKSVKLNKDTIKAKLGELRPVVKMSKIYNTELETAPNGGVIPWKYLTAEKLHIIHADIAPCLIQVYEKWTNQFPMENNNEYVTEVFYFPISKTIVVTKEEEYGLQRHIFFKKKEENEDYEKICEKNIPLFYLSEDHEGKIWGVSYDFLFTMRYNSFNLNQHRIRDYVIETQFPYESYIGNYYKVISSKWNGDILIYSAKNLRFLNESYEDKFEVELLNYKKKIQCCLFLSNNLIAIVKGTQTPILYFYNINRNTLVKRNEIEGNGIYSDNPKHCLFTKDKDLYWLYNASEFNIKRISLYDFKLISQVKFYAFLNESILYGFFRGSLWISQYESFFHFGKELDICTKSYLRAMKRGLKGKGATLSENTFVTYSDDN